MGTDASIWCRTKNKRIYIDRLYNLDNVYVDSDYLDYLKEREIGLPKFLLVEILLHLSELVDTAQGHKNLEFRIGGYHSQILEELEPFDEEDYFCLIDESEDDYYDITTKCDETL